MGRRRRLTDELVRTVRAINLLADADDRIVLLAMNALWSIENSDATGAMVDWPGCPLVITEETGGLVVHAEVGSLCQARP